MVSFLRKERDINDFCPQRQLSPSIDNFLGLKRRASGQSQEQQTA
jgi:hypothetical protein